MTRRRRPKSAYPGGSSFTRARKQFQVLYEKEGSFKRALALQDLILWPEIKDPDGNQIRPPDHILEQWAMEVDDGHAEIPDKLRRQFIKRYDAAAEAAVREALIENAKTAKALAIKVREGKLAPEYSSQYMHANNGTSFMWKETKGVRSLDPAKKVGKMKLMAPRKLKDGAIEAEYQRLP